MRRILIAFFLVMSMASPLFSQSKKYNKDQKNTFLDADSYYVYGDFNTALKLFLSLENIDEDFNELNYKIGYSYYQIKKEKEAIPYLIQGANYDKEAYYYLAKIYLSREELQKAEEALNEYEKRWRENAKYNKEDIQFIRNKIKTAREALANPEKVNIYNLGPNINTANDEYVPLIDGDEGTLIFTSKRETENNGMSPSGLPFEDVYISRRQPSGDWSKAVEIPGEINTGGNDACVGLSPDGERLFIFRPNENLIAGDIYESVYNGKIWTKPVILDDHVNNFKSIEASASLSLDGNTLFFSSNREGGYGGFDIYRVVKLPNGEWSWPKNLGPKINTSRNEDAPFIHPDGKTLYFSSQGHKNMGGYDIFKSTMIETDLWSDPENLAYPTNTCGDDIHFVISSNEQRGYYSSFKESGFGGQDIYQIDYLEKSLRQSVIRAYVKDKNGKPVQADISVLDLETGELSGVYLSNPRNGSFIFLVNPNISYELLVEAANFEEYIEELSYSVEDLKERQVLQIPLTALPKN